MSSRIDSDNGEDFVMVKAKHIVIDSIQRTPFGTLTHNCIFEVVYPTYSLATSVWLESKDEMDAYFKLLEYVEKE